MGIVTTGELMQNTNPYYRSSYALVQRADAQTKADALTDPKLADLRIGAVARTPPIDLLARQGLLKNVTPYALVVDTRYREPRAATWSRTWPPARSTSACYGGRSPATGPNSRPSRSRWSLSPARNRGRLDFRIAMGLRRNEPEWKQVLNDFIAKHKAEIQAILLEYGVPLLDEQGRPDQGCGRHAAGRLSTARRSRLHEPGSATARTPVGR